jgi:diadenosine tetraphosphate (Ap4A) HIT family hydrolase
MGESEVIGRGGIDAPSAAVVRNASSEVVAGNELAAAIADGFPVNPGHTLIVPRRCEPDFRNLTQNEQSAVWALVDPVCRFIETLRMDTTSESTLVRRPGRPGPMPTCM